MNVEEKCGCGAVIEIDEPTMQKPSAEVRDVLADFRVAHQCTHRSGGMESSGKAVAAYPSPSPVPVAASSGSPSGSPF